MREKVYNTLYDKASDLNLDHFSKINTHYGSMWVANQDMVIGRSLRMSGEFEESVVGDVVSFLQKHCGFKKDTFIDIGANIGTHLVYSLKKLSFKKAIGIEPDPLNFSLLALNIRENEIENRAQIFNIGISDSTSAALLALSESNFGDHQIYAASEDPYYYELKTEEGLITAEKVATRKQLNILVEKFDEFILKNNINIESDTLVWIDTQGHEGRVIKGFENLNQVHQPFVVMEFAPHLLKQSGGLESLLGFFRSCSAVLDLGKKNWWENPSPLSEADILTLYNDFLSIQDPLTLSFTDLLCIPKHMNLKKTRKLNPAYFILVLKIIINRFYMLMIKWLKINQIRIEQFKKDPSLHLTKRESSTMLKSELCHYEKLNSDPFRGWIRKLGYEWTPHRKYWELAFICQALFERNMLYEGSRGLGFAVGIERLPSLFASLGCKITATDLPSDDIRNQPWAETKQWGGSLDALYYPALCSKEKFISNMSYVPVDMNDIPNNLQGYDFTWSTCSFEHCGSIDLGIRFIEEQMKCLKPGGIAVHTTEMNLTSNKDTLETPTLSVFRLRDIETICRKLTEKGYQVEPIDVFTGRHEMDKYVDQPPYKNHDSDEILHMKHLRLMLGQYVSTSIALIIKK